MQSEERGGAPGRISLCDAIENDIATGFYNGGERLEEARLANRHGVSRTPVREALRQLAAIGMIEIRPNRGAFVARRNTADLIEMFEVMAELEGMCGRLAARRITPGPLAELHAAHRECCAAEDSGDPHAYYYANERFHRLIYDASRNGFLAKQAEALHRRLKPFRRLQLRAPGRVAKSREEHQTILDAISRGMADEAETALKAHVMIQGDRFADFIAAVAEPGNGQEDNGLTRKDGSHG